MEAKNLATWPDFVRARAVSIQSRYAFVIIGQKPDGSDMEPLPTSRMREAEVRSLNLNSLGYETHVRIQRARGFASYAAAASDRIG